MGNSSGNYFTKDLKINGGCHFTIVVINTKYLLSIMHFTLNKCDAHLGYTKARPILKAKYKGFHRTLSISSNL